MIGRLVLPLCFFFSIGLTTRQLGLAAAASSSKVVTTLPGFDGLLPFHLESGYVVVDEVNDAELFYYFAESEAGGKDAPFLLWLTGGDHCSVLSGLALGIGVQAGRSPLLNLKTCGAYLSYFWAEDESTRDALGINNRTVEEWLRCHSGELPYTKDITSSIKYHRNVTSNGYRALVYRFTITYSNNMTFATVKGAGHPAPEFEPERCFAMFSRWILNQQL
ncbi:hypothetical protein ACQ4PT_058724 [Festuca glaucescens]